MSQIYKPLSSGGPIPGNIPTKFLLDDGNIAVPLANEIIVHGVGATTSLVSSNEIVITIINEGFLWSEQTSNFNAYFCNNGLTATLPATSGLVIGNTIIIYVDTSSPVIIQAGSGQMIQVGSTISGAGGTTTSNTRGSILELIFKPSDLTWHTQSSLGVWNTV